MLYIHSLSTPSTKHTFKLNSIIGSCAGAMCAGLCCGACRQCSGHKNGVISRIPYIFLFFIAGVFSIVMSLYGEEKLNLEFYSAKLCNNETCVGNGSVFRVSFCLFVFELLHCIIIGAGAISFHWLWFAIKFIVCTYTHTHTNNILALFVLYLGICRWINVHIYIWSQRWIIE